MWVPLAEAAPDDDVLHPPAPGGDWSEHHYFFFTDASTGIAGGCRVAWRAEEDVSKAMLFAFLPDGVALWQQDGGSDRLGVGPLSFSGERLGEWRVCFDAEVLVLPDGLGLAGLRPMTGDMAATSLTLDLRFTPLTPALEAAPGVEARALVERIAPRRFEQAGRYDGVARVGDKSVTWSGPGTRDHSWGNRGAQGLQEWKWCTFPLGEELSGGAGHVVLDDGEITSGWLADRGGLADVRAATVDYTFDDDGVVPTAATVTLATDGGERRARATVVAPLGMRVVEHGRPVLAIESLARWSVDDGPTGYGVVEYIRAE